MSEAIQTGYEFHNPLTGNISPLGSKLQFGKVMFDRAREKNDSSYISYAVGLLALPLLPKTLQIIQFFRISLNDFLSGFADLNQGQTRALILQQIYMGARVLDECC